MDHGKLIMHSGFYILLWMVLGACSSSPANDQQNTQLQALLARSVTLVDGGLLRSQSGQPELGLTLANASGQMLWVSAHFRTPDGATDCVLFRELEPQGNHLFLCPQPNIEANTQYPVRIEIFDTIDQGKPVETVDTSFRFSKADIQALKS